jgi:signal transduction histidine kinase
MMSFNSLTHIIPKDQNISQEYRRRTQLVALAIIITAGFALFYFVVSWITEFPQGMQIMTYCFLGIITTFLLLKFGVNVYIVANIFALVESLSIFGCIYYSGGVYSPVFPWLVETPIVLILIAGKKNGYAWVTISLAMAALFGILSYSGFAFPYDYDKTKETFFFLTCNIGLVLIIFFISLIFENFRISAYNQVTRQKDALQSALSDLKTAQAQLIQSEKMASLGEMMAGIAHEIQNPLNFVNNFSEVSTELLDEMNEELDTNNVEEAKIITSSIKQNLDKINYHGNRAGAIVRGMLQHSQSGSGVKTLTNINALANEYFRLAYHGLRAKDKSFQATMHTDFDESIEKINIVPQDIGRVILNLINNAFYEVHQKKHQLLKGHPDNNFEPVVTVRTKKLDNGIEINVMDNGNGIPEYVKKKIFQPFFTTKPSGQGTGLGLSLSYDIVNAHGGELKVETKEGEGTEFIIHLPA